MVRKRCLIWTGLLLWVLSQGALGSAATDGPILACPDRVGLGRAFLVRITSTAPMAGLALVWQGRTLSPDVSEWKGRQVALALLGTDVLQDKPGPRELTVRIDADGRVQTLTRQVLIEKKSYPRQDLTLPPRMVTPPPEVLARIKAERELTRQARETQSPERHWALPLLRPVPGEISSDYGLRRYLNKQPKDPHRGLDFRASAGDGILAVGAGTVVLTGDHYYAGKSVYVDHGNGVVSMYFHMSRIKVRTGDRVARGQALGLVGATGRSTGPHLHLSVAVQGALVDPVPLMTLGQDVLLTRP